MYTTALFPVFGSVVGIENRKEGRCWIHYITDTIGTPTDPLDYKKVCQVSIMVSVIRQDKMAQLAAIFFPSFLYGICNGGSL